MDNYDAAWIATWVPGALLLVYGHLNGQPTHVMFASGILFLLSLIYVLAGIVHVMYNSAQRMRGEQ